MEDGILKTILHHWHLALALYLVSTAISTMPSPNGTGWRASWGYKWLFGFLHVGAGNLPRVIAVMFPRLIRALAKRFLGVDIPVDDVGSSPATSNDNQAAKAVAGN